MPVEHAFLLQRVQPAMVGLVDGSLSTLAPIFAVVLASHDTRYAFIAGLATALGAAVSMGFSEGLSDTGELTGRARHDHRRGHVSRRDLAHAAVPDPALSGRIVLRDRRRRARARHARVPALAV